MVVDALPSPSGKSVAVLGGGIVGLSAAYRLMALGHRVRLFEQSAHLGGVIRSEEIDGWLVEAGPNSFQESGAEVRALLRELDLDEQRIEANPAARNRYLAHRGRLVAAPLSPPALLASSLFSPIAKLRILAETLWRPRVRDCDISVAAFVRAHFGEELLVRAVQPLVSGIYAGDPNKLSAQYAFPKLWQLERTHGSLLRGQIAAAKARRNRGETAVPKIVSFRRGLQALPDALAARLPGSVQTNARVTSLVRSGSWELSWTKDSTPHTETFDAAIAALPAGALAELAIGESGHRPLATLAGIEYPPVAALFLGFRREAVAHALDGFGALIPQQEARTSLGIIFSSTLFPRRAPEGHVALTVMVGGALRPELAKFSSDALLPLVMRDLRDLLGVRGDPVFLRHHAWPRAIPQYVLGYERHLAAMEAVERSSPGLFIGGSVRDGIALPDCLLAGARLAERAAAAVASPRR